MELKTFFAQDLNGPVIPSATVTVYLPGTTTLAPGLQNATGGVLTNPFTGGGNGQVTLAAPDGDYDIKVEGAGRSTTMRVRFSDGGLLREDLASPGTGKGDDILATAAHTFSKVSEALAEIDWASQQAPQGVNVLRYIPPSEWPAILAGTSTYNATADIQAAIDANDTVFFPDGKYRTVAPAADRANLYIGRGGVRLFGAGGALLTAETNTATVIHVSPEPDLDVLPGVGEIDGFEVQGLRIQGTGVYAYAGLAYGRGVLLRRVKNSHVHHNRIDGMSMIGVSVEGGLGANRITDNRLHGCKFGSIAINGRGYLSIISGNICTGSDGTVNSLAIQATGPCLVTKNTIFGDVTNFANCGGIAWGEGNYDGIGGVTNNLILHCRFGIKTVYHGAVNITGNTIINCRTTGGINCVGGTAGGFTVPSNHNGITGNLLVNNAPYQIDVSAEGCVVQGNQCLNIAAPTIPSAGTEPDSIVAVSTQVGIRIRAAYCSVVGNTVDGGVRGIVTTLGQETGAMGFNTVRNTSSSPYAWEAATGTFIGGYVHNRTSVGGSTYIDQVFSGSIPTQGYFALASTWRPTTYAVGQPIGAVVLQARIDTTTATAAAGDVAIVIAGAASFTTGANAKVGVQLDNGTYHWTTIASNAGNTITLAAAIPAGRSVAIGAAVYVNVWRTEANLA